MQCSLHNGTENDPHNTGTTAHSRETALSNYATNRQPDLLNTPRPALKEVQFCLHYRPLPELRWNRLTKGPLAAGAARTTIEHRAASSPRAIPSPLSACSPRADRYFIAPSTAWTIRADRYFLGRPGLTKQLMPKPQGYPSRPSSRFPPPVRIDSRGRSRYPPKGRGRHGTHSPVRRLAGAAVSQQARAGTVPRQWSTFSDVLACRALDSSRPGSRPDRDCGPRSGPVAAAGHGGAAWPSLAASDRTPGQAAG